MKFQLVLAAFVAALITTPGAFAQHAHSDIEFGYERDNASNPIGFEIEGDEITSDGFQFWESEFEELDPTNDSGNFSTDEPGFETNGDEGLVINNGDSVFLTAVDASAHSSFGVGYVNFFNPTSGMLEASGRISIIDNSAGIADLILNGGSVESGPEAQFLGLGTDTDDDGNPVDGSLHDHIVIDLLDDSTAATGAYGIMFQLQSSLAGTDLNTMDVTSDEFWIIINNGMDEEDFEGAALSAFGVSAIPEPSSALLLAAGLGGLFIRRRR